MTEADRFLEEKINRGRKQPPPAPLSTEPRASHLPNNSPPMDVEMGRWNGMKYFLAAMASIVVWLLFCFGLAAAGLHGGGITFGILFLVIIPSVWAGVLACFPDKKS